VLEEYHRRETSNRISGSTQNLYLISVDIQLYKIDRFEVDLGNKIIERPDHRSGRRPGDARVSGMSTAGRIERPEGRALRQGRFPTAHQHRLQREDSPCQCRIEADVLPPPLTSIPVGSVARAPIGPTWAASGIVCASMLAPISITMAPASIIRRQGTVIFRSKPPKERSRNRCLREDRVSSANRHADKSRRALSYQPASAHHDALGGENQSDLGFRAPNHRN